MPVLDLSGIDLDLNVEDLSDVAAETTTAEAEAEAEEEAIVAQPVLEVAPEFNPFADLSETADFEPTQEFQPEAEVSVEASPADAEAGIDPELHEEVNTKLDLARAYLEMGDREGAREILQEVLGEGDSKQKAEADKLLADAG
jgi:pilus assembly protein FimV